MMGLCEKQVCRSLTAFMIEIRNSWLEKMESRLKGMETGLANP
jgi:hypothetical protein